MNAPPNFAVFDLKLPLGDQVPERLPRWDLGSNLFRDGDLPGWLALETPPEPPETLSWALLDPLGRLESLSPWSMVLGPWSLVPGPWFLVPGP